MSEGPGTGPDRARTAEESRRRRLEGELLVARCQLGETEAFDELVARWHPPLWCYVRAMSGDPAVAEEILQEGFAHPPVDEVQRRLARELSVPYRLGVTLLLLFDLAVLGVVGAVWLTERSLPLRTHLAFGAIVLVALAWAGFFGWTLGRRKVLLVRHRLMAARLAVVFTTLYTGGAVSLAVLVPELRSGAAAAVFGVALLTVAGLLLRRARDRHEALLRRRAELEHELAR